MASTFHQFSRLPAEVRWQIWEEACFPRQSRGLHYATLDATLHFVSHHFPGNRSAYSWDGGLWMACKESRVALEKHHYMQEWKESELRDPTEYQYSESWMGSEKEAPGLVAVHDDHQAWHCVVYPARDIFCVTAHNNDWESVMESWPWYGLLVIVPFIEDVTTLRVDNIALEFDPSWNVELSRDGYRFNDRKSPGSFLVRMLLDLAREDGIPNIWLIDNSARWRAKPGRDISPVSYGSDGEYVEIDWGEVCFDEVNEEYKSSIVCFIQDLSREFDENLADAGRGDWTPDPYVDQIMMYYPITVDRSVRLLVRRDNQVTKFVD
ncbi:hypothetical protein FDECE_7410 [Fusarium decemcellulare]|nr:hypothetical protein FDECE_7410 [Fusarium decemcellulare]